jgi:chaperone required for assembly of F1-ATPase
MLTNRQKLANSLTPLALELYERAVITTQETIVAFLIDEMNKETSVDRVFVLNSVITKVSEMTLDQLLDWKAN